LSVNRIFNIDQIGGLTEEKKGNSMEYNVYMWKVGSSDQYTRIAEGVDHSTASDLVEYWMNKDPDVDCYMVAVEDDFLMKD